MGSGGTSGDLSELGARVRRANLRTAEMVKQLTSGSAAPGEVEKIVTELSTLRTLLDGDPRFRGLVTARLGALLAARYSSGRGTPEDRERAQLLLKEVRDPSGPAGRGLPAEERRWAALFLLVVSGPAVPGGRPGMPASLWQVLDGFDEVEHGIRAADSAELAALSEEAGQLPLPPEVLAPLRQLRDISAYLQRGGYVDPEGLLEQLPADFPLLEDLRLLASTVKDVPAEPVAQPADPHPEPDTGKAAENATPLARSWISALLGTREALRTGDPEALDRLLDRLGKESGRPVDDEGRAEIQNLMRLVLQLGPSFSNSHQDAAVADDHVQAIADHFESSSDFARDSELGVVIRTITLLSEVRKAEHTESATELGRLVGELESLERSTPADHTHRWMVLLALGSALNSLSLHTGDEGNVLLRRSVSYQEEALTLVEDLHLPDSFHTQLRNAVRTTRASLESDPALLPGHATGPPEASGESHYGSALTATVRYSLTREPADLDEAIAALECVRDEVRRGRSTHVAAHALWQLAGNYRTRESYTRDPADGEAAFQAALETLQVLAGDVVLQTGPEHGLLAARRGADYGVAAAGWAAARGRVEDAVTALELGRALVLQAASTTRAVPELLEGRGRLGLACAWRAAGGDGGDGGAGPAVLPRELPSSLRRRALEALGYRDREGGLFGTPTVADLQAAVARGDADALVYLLAGPDDAPGLAVIVGPDVGTAVRVLPGLARPASGPLERYLDAAAERQRTGSAPAVRAWEGALLELCDWAAGAVIAPVLTSIVERIATGESRGKGRSGPPRIVLVPCGRLGIVPWHAARFPAGAAHRYACEALVISYAASGRHFADSAGRARRAPEDDPVLVADPSQTLTHVELEVTSLHESCYPRARLIGELYEPPVEPESPGTPDDVIDALDGAPSLLHVACHGSAGTSPTASALQLAPPAPAPDPDADADRLTVARLLSRRRGEESASGGPLVVLSACETDLSNRDHDEALTLTTAFLSRGARDVVGSRWATRDSAAALMMAVFHHYLCIDGHSPADALRAAQLWMLDPGRRAPESLSDRLRHELGKVPRLDHPAAWAAFTHQGHPGPAPPAPGRSRTRPRPAVLTVRRWNSVPSYGSPSR